MKTLLMFAMCLMLLAAMAGCGKKSSLEGKVVDGKGKPLAGVKVQALQEQPLKGYEFFECTTGTDGYFKFGKLFPASAYTLITHLDDTPSNFKSIKIMSAPEGQTMILPESITIQKTTLEGKIADGTGKPLAGVKLIAVQLQPYDKGNGVFMSTTNADGNFKFSTLFPNATYTLSTSDSIELLKEIMSSSEGQTKILPEPIIIRFKKPKDGAPTIDTKNGLMWANDANIAGKRMNWNEAVEWVKRLDFAGHKDWRMPSKVELVEFGKSVDTGSDYKNFQTDFYWSSTEGSSKNNAWMASMYAGNSSSYENNKSKLHYVWPVRAGQ
jgi:hypothetical protein